MKKPSPILANLIRAALVLIAAAITSTARADGPSDTGDFNRDGLEDIAAITGPTTVTVSLLNLDGSYTVCAILSTPKNRTITYIEAIDLNGDDLLDVYAVSPAGGNSWYVFRWLGNGDGGFVPGETSKFSWPQKGGVHGSF